MIFSCEISVFSHRTIFRALKASLAYHFRDAFSPRIRLVCAYLTDVLCSLVYARRGARSELELASSLCGLRRSRRSARLRSTVSSCITTLLAARSLLCCAPTASSCAAVFSAALSARRAPGHVPPSSSRQARPNAASPCSPSRVDFESNPYPCEVSAHFCPIFCRKKGAGIPLSLSLSLAARACARGKNAPKSAKTSHGWALLREKRLKFPSKAARVGAARTRVRTANTF